MANRTVSVNLVANIGQYVSGMNTAAGATMRLGDTATTSTKKAQSGFDLAGKGALLMGAAVVGGMAMAVSKSMEFEKAMSAAGAATRASGTALGDLRDAAMKAGADTAYSASEAAQAITEMGKAGVSTADILDGGLNGALSLAAAGQLDVAKAAEIASVAMTQFKLSGDQLPHVADLLAAGAGKAMGSVEDLGMALNQAGLVASSTGLSIEETTGSLAAFASAGLVGSDAGTSLRSMLLHLQNATGPAATEMEKYGISLYDASGQFVGMENLAGQLQTKLGGLTQETRDAAMAQIFGSDAVRAANVLYTEGSDGIAEWTSKVNDAGYAADQAARLQDNLAGDLEKLGGAFDTFLIALGEGAQGPLRELVQGLTGILDVGADLIGFWQSLPGPVQLAIGTLAAVAALKGPVGGALETIGLKALYARDMMSGASLNMGGLAKAGSGLLGVFGGPWGLAITGATVGLSLLVSWMSKGDDATNDLADAQHTLTSALQVTNGVIDESVRRAAAKALQDENLLKFTELYGVSSRDMVGYVLNEAGAHDRVSESLQRYRSTLEDKLTGDKDADIVTRGLIGAVDDHIAALDGLATGTDSTIVKERELAVATGQTGGAMQASTAQTEEAAAALEEWLKALQGISAGFVEPLGIYTELLGQKQEAERASAEATAAATSSSTDSWKDYVSDVGVSLDEYATKLEEQLIAQDNWRMNIGIITQRGGYEVGQILTNMGVEGVQLAADMADGTDAEFNRMADLLIEDARRGGAGAAAALDQEMKVMAAIGAAGAGATALGIAQQLGIGLGEVRRIAGQYNVEMATGLEPLLAALGQRTIALRARGGGMAGGINLWDGGYTGDGGKYEPKGVVHGGEFVLTKEQTARLGIDRIEEFANNGYAKGGFVTAADVPRPRSTSPYGAPVSTTGDLSMQTAYGETLAWMAAHPPPGDSRGGPATANGVGGLGPAAARAHAFVRSNWGFGGTIGGYANRNIAGTNQKSKHALGKAIDVMIGRNMGLGQSIADYFSGPGRRPFGVDNVIWNRRINSGRGWTGYNGVSPHTDHPHVDFYKTGTSYVPHDGPAILHKGEAVIPAHINARSREFSGGGGGGGSNAVSVSIDGARIVGSLMVNGLEAQIDGQIVSALTSVNRGMAAQGVR